MLTDFQELWITSRKGSLPKLNELKSINVAKTCDKLRLAITQPRNGRERTLDITHRRHTEELTFRNVSCLCYTTLRVHEMQVNDLLNKSAALVAQSRNWSTIRARKRCQQSNCNDTYRSKRKRRLTVEHSMQDVSFVNYTELLDESESFLEWSTSEAFVNKKVTKANNQCRTTCIHIREITINEIDMHPVDEDEGFGSGTADEINTFLQLLSDTPAAPVMEASTIKRKGIETSSICEKKSRIEYGSKNEISRVGLEYFVEVVEEDGAKKKSMSAIETCPNNKMLFNDSHDNAQINLTPITEMSSVNGDTIKSCDAIINDDIVAAIETSIPNAHNYTTKLQNDEANSICSVNQKQQNFIAPCNLLNKSKSNPKQTIIDERIELTETEMRTQLQAKINFRKQLRKIRAKIKWRKKIYLNSVKSYDKILPSASELLTTVNRSCITIRKLKMRSQTARKNFDVTLVSSAYRSLLGEILNCEINDDLATQIYKNWNKFEKANSKNRCQRVLTPMPENIPYIQEENDYNQISIQLNNTITFSNNNNNNNSLECVADNCASSNDQDEWGAFDVMVKLLNLWRSKNVLGDEIPIEYLLQPTAVAKKQAAKGFSALLKLSASGFIVLLSPQNSIRLQGIKLGAASVKLIQINEVNGMQLRRANNAS